ncbi:uncharacterized protein LOC133322345 [Musca vetustissima]|uniref:uncharacterized protein LOC133322345 n=1 Tax=Musca vetustissima TaxID=27455 RepID=UPI002AB729C6|nr:uncharacterized protein LOC133322345 [Musca vetustissima]
MDVICHSNIRCPKSKFSVSKCRVKSEKISTRPRKIPALNTFGPFPDETITIALDRILYFLGGRKIQKYFNNEPTSSSDRSQCSIRRVSYRDCAKLQKESCRESQGESPQSNNNIPSSNISNRSSKYSTCSSFSRKSTPSVIIREETHGDSSCLRRSVQSLKRSFSLCSLACRKIRDKLLLGKECCSPPRWLWTKLQDYGDGCQVYEVFTNSSTSSHPSQFESDRAPRIIFVILPTGVIMPFETLIRH